MAPQGSIREQIYGIGGLVKKAGFTSVDDASASKSAEPVFTFAQLDSDLLEPAPIRPEWVLEGSPEAKCCNLSVSTGRLATTDHWSCTKGKFRWHFEWDETVLFLEGAVTITDDRGIVYHGRPGVSLFFPAGTSAIWEVDHYIRKLAFNSRPLSPPLNFLSRVERKLLKILKL